ncbi:MAG: alkaline phosphatase family protein [Clostridiales bacterium]|jgi:hypothetical protein|nr:alkaline phosphatase family protein [Clostridiales bacterium]
MNEYELCYPDYKKSIVNISSALSAYFGAEHYHEPLFSLERFLTEGKFEKVVFLVTDGFGAWNQDICLDETSFLIGNRLDTVSSVFPPTTAAALTSIEREQFPNAHCRLGWAMYFGDIKKSIEVFSGKTYGQRIKLRGYNKVDRDLPHSVKSVCERIAETGVAVNYISAFASGADRHFTFGGIAERIKKLCENTERRFIYAYFNEPDNTFHDKGVYSEASKQTARSLDETLKSLAAALPSDTALIVTCDHGQVDAAKNTFMREIPGLKACLSATPSLEPLAISFRIKKGKEDDFLKIMRKYAPGYKVFTKQEVLDAQLYGTGENHPRMSEFIGDYLTVGIGDSFIWTHKEFIRMKGVHAGMHKGTMLCAVAAARGRKTN